MQQEISVHLVFCQLAVAMQRTEGGKVLEQVHHKHNPQKHRCH
jgi:hypothetical protein